MNSRRKLNIVLLVVVLTLLAGAVVVGQRLILGWREMAELSAQNKPDYQRGKQDQVEREEEENGTDHPDGALRFRRLQMEDEKGEIPPDALVKAHQHMRLMKAEQQRRIKAQQQSGKPQRILEAGLAPDSWTWLGPGNVGGRIRSVVINPANTANMWVGSVGGGIWRTTNSGTSWQPVNDFLASLAVSTMVISPTNGNIMYAGTGEIFASDISNPSSSFTPDGLRGDGVFKSTDGGITWSQLTGTTSSGCALLCPWWYVSRLAISPDGNTILAATGNGIWRSTDGGANWTLGGGVSGIYLDVDFDPTNNQKAIAGAAGVAVYSTNGGLSWLAATFSPAISGRVEIAYAPSNPSIVYASVDQNSGNFYKSTNGGQSYTRVNSNISPAGYTLLGTQGYYDNIVWVNPQDPNFVIVAGVFPYRSTDGGLNFTAIGDSSTNLPHNDHHMIVVHPGFNNTTNRTLYFGNDGGIFRLNDAGVAPTSMVWVNLNNNLGITQFYGAAGNAGGLIGGTQDNGNVRFTGATETWAPITGMGGDGGYCAADPTNSQYFYGEYVYLRISRSTDGGVSGSIISNGIADANNGAAANFIAPFILDPNNSNTMLAGGLSLWRSNDVKSFIPAPTWTAVPKPNPNSSLISAIAISPSTSTIVAVGHNNGDLFLTFNGTDAAPNWVKVDTANLPNRFVTRLTIDSTRSPSWIYVTFGGFSGDNVYRTTNFGATWTDMSGTGLSGLPAVPVRSLVFHPSNPNLLYVGTEIGIFTSDNGGTNWEPTQDGPANVSVDELFWMGGDLIAATHGRGIYRASGGVYVDCNWNGPFNGTFAQPFKTITAAVNAVTSYRTIWVKPCHYNEKFLLPNNAINKHLEIRSLGGTALIGKP